MTRQLILICGISGVLFAPDLAGQESATGRGTVTLGGAGRLSSFRDIGNDQRSFIMDLNPRVGWFVASRLALSANAVYQRFSNEFSVSSTWGVGPGLTYYFGSGEETVLPFLSGRSLLRWSGAPGSDWRTVSLLGGAGLVFMVSRHVGVRAELFYQWNGTTVSSGSVTGGNTSEEFGVLFGVTAFVF